ncbi:MAG: response regulator [Thermoanaerobaculaceae bacterium]|nr:response regulator [Thermoanaerobaculaceae bacterium]
MKEKILIVEDSVIHQKIYEIFLSSREKFVLLCASNGREGLEVLAANPDVSMIILDINMPLMSGLEFLKIVKKEESLKDIPVIICSTEGSEEDIIRGLKCGASAYIKKPFTSDELLALMNEINKRRMNQNRNNGSL